jgi:DNA-binding MarR family transcriptional regulator
MARLEWFNREHHSSILNQRPPRGNVSDAVPTTTSIASWLAVVRAYNLCDRLLTTRLAEVGVRVGEHEVLANLLRQPGITQQELAARCFVAKSGVSMLLDGMEAGRLVRRESDAADARVRRLFLTAAGERLARKTQAVQAEVVATMAEPVDAAELDAVADVMRRVSARLEAAIAARGVSRASAPRSRRRSPARPG